MDPTLFYTPAAEWAKAMLYVPLFLLVATGYVRYRRGNRTTWDNWIHAAIMINFVIGALYSGIRMLTTDPMNDMIVRRIFAAEAWFNFACASFYFLALRFFRLRQESVDTTASQESPTVRLV